MLYFVFWEINVGMGILDIFVPAVLSPEIATACCAGTARIWSKVATHRRENTQSPFNKVSSFCKYLSQVSLIVVIRSPKTQCTKDTF